MGLDGGEEPAGVLHLPDVVPDGGKTGFRLCQSSKEQPGQLHILHFFRLHGLGDPVGKGGSAVGCDGVSLFAAFSLGRFAGRRLALFHQLGESCLYAARAVGADESQVFLDELLQLISRHGGENEQP